jgi:hypothetical protein
VRGKIIIFYYSLLLQYSRTDRLALQLGPSGSPTPTQTPTQTQTPTPTQTQTQTQTPTQTATVTATTSATDTAAATVRTARTTTTITTATPHTVTSTNQHYALSYWGLIFLSLGRAYCIPSGLISLARSMVVRTIGLK